jgi:protein-glutamine gamma-glutamyltransferase
MFRIEPLIQFLIFTLVLISGSLLGMSLSHPHLVAIVVLAGISGYLITDRLHLFQLDGFLANIASILILLIAMRDFFPGDSTGKLISVANLLVYLQALLMFQAKTPRLIWQILTLSLLQVVVAAIFSLNLEAGILFVLYFLLAGITLALQLFFKNNRDIVQINRASAKSAFAHLEGSRDPAPMVFFFDPEPRNTRTLKQLVKHLLVWFIIALCFTMVMFYMIPRQTQPWVGGTQVEITALSPSQSVDLLNRGQIPQSNQVLFRAQFEKLDGGDTFQPAEPPYFRGVALSSLIIENGNTNWRAPNDRVFSDTYRDLGLLGEGPGRVKQTVTAEENRHPVVYSSMPAFTYNTLNSSIEYCHEISALTRCKLNAPLDMAPFRYELVTLVDENGAWLESWPYYTNHSGYGSFPMSVDPLEREWLTQHHPERYPTLVEIGRKTVSDLKENSPQVTQREICRALEAYFLEPGRFSYTLDYRSVTRDDRLDPNEDFVRNHRAGHCEMFASALTLMLRSQNIPARLVTGFHGGDPNQLSDGLMVRARHAHAWVEAYLPPEECTPQMLREGAASSGGAWLRLDPTPATINNSGVGVGTEAIDLARSFWQDYILGMNAELNRSDPELINNQLINFFQNFQFDGWERAIFSFDATIKSGSFRQLMAALIILPPLLTWLFTSYFKFRKSNRRNSPPKSLRQWLATAVSWVSPGLGKWILTRQKHSTEDTQFYDRLIGILKAQGMERSTQQSQRDFAKTVRQQFANHPQTGLISSVVFEVSEIYNEVRFGKHSIPKELREQIDQCLNELEAELQQPSKLNLV